GAFLFPQIILLRIIGRLAFPLFAWLIANGAYYTHDIKSYLKRLFIFALISQIPFTLANLMIGQPLLYLNVFFTLLLGLLTIYVIQKYPNKWLWLATALVAAGAADLIHSDYGAAGVLSVVMFYLFREKFVYMAISQVFILGILPWLANYILLQTFYLPLMSFYMTSSYEWYGLIALLFIFLYNKKPGWKDHHLLYWIYPVQFIVFYLLRLF
ncbi:MAG: hypothetical protein KGJ35_03605, partial [Patescibacteria group bacterium]|nr:hypothetical protein [Patescibacteria group bacterium]